MDRPNRINPRRMGAQALPPTLLSPASRGQSDSFTAVIWTCRRLGRIGLALLDASFAGMSSAQAEWLGDHVRPHFDSLVHLAITLEGDSDDEA